ncbi:MAG: 16S rRNA (adenine(1518)-N(6)/adenine(1519)-N(6))-dimethyltransferase RsmA [Vicingaceae bacterium]
MKKVRAKKQLGQHFLNDPNIAMDTVDAFGQLGNFKHAIEVGPGMGVLTKPLIARNDLKTTVVDIDQESIAWLAEEGYLKDEQIISGDFLQLDLNHLFKGEDFGIIGNFPYNISTQILFKALEYRSNCKEVVGMFQKEVADRIACRPGSKVYGITSVLLQAYYHIDYLFTVEPEVFDPPPKVKSAVIRLRRNEVEKLDCDEKKFKQIIKMSFNQRRKTLRNSLKALLSDEMKQDDFFNKRPEQLSVAEFIQLTQRLQAEG